MSRRRIPFEIDDPSDHVNSKLIEKQQDQLIETPQDLEETEKQKEKKSLTTKYTSQLETYLKNQKTVKILQHFLILKQVLLSSCLLSFLKTNQMLCLRL